MKNIQSLLLAATVALLFLVGKYAATYTGIAGTLRGLLPWYWVSEKGPFV
jgi:hypothetical protein